MVEQRLYEVILALMREGRLPKTFKIQPARDVNEEKVMSMVEELSRTLGELGERVRRLEEQLSAQDEPKPQDGQPGSLSTADSQ